MGAVSMPCWQCASVMPRMQVEGPGALQNMLCGTQEQCNPPLWASSDMCDCHITSHLPL